MDEGKEWLEDQVKTGELRQIFTPLTYSHKNGNEEEVEYLNDISELLGDDTLVKDGPVRILVQGTLSYRSFTETLDSFEEGSLDQIILFIKSSLMLQV